MFKYFVSANRRFLFSGGEIEFRSAPLPSGELLRIRRLQEATLEDAACGLPEDRKARLRSLGYCLYERLLPRELQGVFCELPRGAAILILAGEEGGPPWELFHDGRWFFGERFIIGRWLREMEKVRPYEFPVGTVSLGYYAGFDGPERWGPLLEPHGAPAVQILPGGVLEDMGTAAGLRGLHLMCIGRRPGEDLRPDAPVLRENGGEDDLAKRVRPVRLDFRRNRPLVTLGYLSGGRPESTLIEQTWAPAFVRAGCSALVGPLWAVDPAVEAAFVGSFYARLWAGDSLGGALRKGRRMARAAANHSVDGLAYVLYGDPMARPYRPVAGEGYASVEAVG